MAGCRSVLLGTATWLSGAKRRVPGAPNPSCSGVRWGVKATLAERCSLVDALCLAVSQVCRKTRA